MVFDLIIKPVVFIDLEEAINFYYKKSNESASRFYQNFLNAVEDIKSNPRNYSYVIKPVRTHIIKKFPYKYFTLLMKIKLLL